MDERSLTHEAHRQDASGDADLNARLLHLLTRALGVLRKDLWDRMRGLVLVRVNGVAECFDLLQFLAAEFVNIFVECQVGSFLSGKQSIIKECDILTVARLGMPRLYVEDFR